MFKLVVYIVSGIVIGVAGTLIAVNWQEEKLRFELSNPATFGEIVYQNLRIVNDGWNPATNVKVFLNHPSVRPRHARSTPNFNISFDEPNALGGYDRLRRGESVTVAFSFKGQPVSPSQVSIKSDRSVARPVARDGGGIDLFSFFLGILAWLALTLAIPGYQQYKKLAGASVSRRGGRPGGRDA